MNANAELARATLEHLAGLGVRDFVVCAGARNAPLVTSLVSVAGEHDFRIRNHFDERAAAFFALGIAKGKREPVAVLTTSGTAVAELLPAAIEGYYAGVPLVLVTADRPASFRGSGAPQAIEQHGIFGRYAPVAVDVSAVTDLSWVLKWERDAPLHLNVCFEEPGADDRVEEIEPVALPRPRRHDHGGDGLSVEAFVAKPEHLVAIVGELPPSWRGNVENFLAELGVPVWAEATSGLRESARLTGQLIRLERGVADLRPREVLRIGGVPSLRFWRDLESLAATEVVSITPRPFSGLARPSRLLCTGDFPSPPELAHVGSVGDPGSLGAGPLEAALAKHPKSEPAVMRRLSEAIPGEALVFLGNSLPIREWNLAATVETPHPRCFANRGANGIDGEIATFLGLAEGEEESWAIVGDLTALYDLNAPALLDPKTVGRRRIVILNNGGGRIFSRLPAMAGLPEEEKAITENRHDRSFAHWSAMWGMEHVNWGAGEPFPEIGDAAVVVEARIDNEATEAFWKDWS